jgi:hypothetical protein
LTKTRVFTLSEKFENLPFLAQLHLNNSFNIRLNDFKKIIMKKSYRQKTSQKVVRTEKHKIRIGQIFAKTFARQIC